MIKRQSNKSFKISMARGYFQVPPNLSLIVIIYNTENYDRCIGNRIVL